MLLKNPFSGQNIISDFEPLPDAIHYVSPARSFISGPGLRIAYEGRSLTPAVPPLYSLFLVPFYFFSNDARSYYFANVLLAISSVGLFYFIMCRLMLNPFLRLLSFFAFCTNVTVYWFPSVAMAENLFLFLYLLSIWLLLSNVNVRNLILAGFLAVSFYATKYIEMIVSGVFGLVYLYKIFNYSKSKNKFYLKVLIFVISIIVPLLFFDAVEYLNKGAHIWPILYLPQLFKSSVVTVVSSFSLPLGSTYLSSGHVIFNIGQYIAGFIGGELTVATQGMVVVSPIIGMIGLIGLFLNPFICKFKLTSVYFLISFFSVLVFSCLFYVTEGRYLFFAVPVLILSFALSVDRLWTFFKSIGRNYLIYLTAIILLALVLFSQLPSVFRELTEKDSIVKANRNYLVVNMINNYFKNTSDYGNIAVISFIPPYIFDYYAKPNYKLLPLSLNQPFMSTPEVTWGEDDYSDLISLYKKYINSGYNLYLSSPKTEYPGSTNIIQNLVLYRDFNTISLNFNLEKIIDGCEGTCVLYKLSLK